MSEVDYQISLEDVQKFAGQYVAIMDGKVVAFGEGLLKKVQSLEKKHPDKEISITYIPKEELLVLGWK